MNKYLLGELEDKILDTVSSYVKDTPKPYGLVFSGGFDSGLLAAITQPKKLFRVVFPYGTKFDESRYANAIVKHLGIESKVVEIEITAQDFKLNFEDAVKAMGEVTTHFSLVPLYILFKRIKEYGTEDILSGEGIDEYLGGYARYIIFDELKKLYEIPELRNYHEIIYKTLDKKFDDIKRNLIHKYAGVMNYLPCKEKYIFSEYPLQGALGFMDMELGQIEKMEQKLANHFGIKLHYPYINEDLAEYCYKLPDDMKVKNGRTKVAFKEIAMKYLPDIVRDRVKMGGPVAPVNQLMGWNLDDFDKTKYIQEQERILR
jgi:asparagine synthase (glutamine-hydrolysing)